MAQDATVIQVKVAPAYPPGQGMAAFNDHVVQVVRSSPILYSDTDTINVFEIPGNVAILGAWLHVTTDFDAGDASVAPSASFSVPYATGAQTIMVAATGTLVSTAGAVATGPFAATPASGGLGIVSYTANTTTAGQFEVYMKYVAL